MLRTVRGFTLIELMIVVVVIGLLAAIAYPAFQNFTNRARIATVKSTMHTVQVTAEDFASRNDGEYPANAGDTTLEGGNTFAALLPGTTMPMNPFTSLPTSLDWSNVAGTVPSTDGAGGVALNVTQSVVGGAYDEYEVIGTDDGGAALSLVLTNH